MRESPLCPASQPSDARWAILSANSDDEDISIFDLVALTIHTIILFSFHHS